MTERRVVWPLGLALLVVVLLALLAWRWSAAKDSRLADRAPVAEADSTVEPLPGVAASDRAADAAAAVLPEIPVEHSPTSALAAPVADATHGLLLVRARWSADGTPAPGIGLRLLQWDRPSPLFHDVIGVTDEHGEWLLRDVLPGKVTAYSDRSKTATADVVAGQLNELVLELPPGVVVRGTVVDPERRPVPGAGIWFCDNLAVDGPPAAHADDGGRFELRGVEPQHYVGAQAPGYTASPIHFVKRGQTEVEFTLVLGPPGGGLRGHVRSHDGAAIADATILVGPEHGWPPPDPAELGSISGPLPVRLTSDAQGAFEVADIRAGRVPLAVRADDWPSWASAVDIAAGQTSEVEVELYPGGTVVGTVRDESGQVVQGAEVSYGRYGEMDWVSAQSGADGRYELAGLRLGTLEFCASLRGGGRAKAQIAVDAGADNEWDPVLQVGLQVFGRVVDDTGAPAPGLHIGASNQRDWHGEDEADADGHFVISNCPEGKTLTLVASDFTKDPPDLSLAILTDVLPGPGAVLLTVPSNRERSAHLVGRVEFTDGTPATDVQLNVTPQGVNFGEVLALDAQGGFRSEAKLAGTYTLHIGGIGFVERRIEGLVLETGRTTDAGVIVVEQPGTVVLKPKLASGFDPGQLHFWLWNKSQDVSLVAQPRPDGTYWARLQAGDYEVRESAAPGQLVAFWSKAFTLAPGQEIEVEVPVERGVLCGVDVALTYNPEHMPTARARVADSSGGVVLETDMQIAEWAKLKKRTASRGFVLKPDAYRFQLMLDGKLALDEPMVVQDLGTESVHFEWRVD